MPGASMRASPTESRGPGTEVMVPATSPPPYNYENPVREPQALSRVISRDLVLF